MNRKRILCIAIAAWVWIAHAQDLAPLRLGPVWAEIPTSNPEQIGSQTGRTLVPLLKASYKFDGDNYESMVSRIKLKLPRIGQETMVSVREAIPFRRPNGQVATSHVLFVPDAAGMQVDERMGVSAVVVTRLRDDRPKDRESVLRQFEPQTAQQREQQGNAGIQYFRVQTEFGEALQRVVRNRLYEEPFPYQMRVASTPNVASVGVTLFVVVEDDSLLEFSQVFPCATLEDQACTQKALVTSSAFVNGVSQFLRYPKDRK